MTTCCNCCLVCCRLNAGEHARFLGYAESIVWLERTPAAKVCIQPCAVTPRLAALALTDASVSQDAGSAQLSMVQPLEIESVKGIKTHSDGQAAIAPQVCLHKCSLVITCL